MSEAKSEIYEFSDFRLDPARHSLERGGVKISLKPKVFDLLVVLVERRGQIVEKEELKQLLWADSFVEENNLTVTMSTLRKVLGDSANEQRFIVTAPNKGYRFIADVRTVSETKSENDNPIIEQTNGTVVSGSKSEIKLQRSRRVWLFGILAAAFILLAAGLIWRSTVKNSTEKPIDSLAVLPFINESGDANTEYFADGVTETLINKFSEHTNLRVTSRTTAFRFKNTKLEPQQVGRELKVRAVLSGKVFVQNDLLTIRVELVDVERDAQLFGESYQIKQSELLGMQEQIAAQISEKLQLRLQNSEQPPGRGETKDAEAYKSYLKGRYHWNKRNAESLQKSVEEFNQAIEHDPTYALAYAGLADAYLIIGTRDFKPPAEALPKARAAALKALEIDNKLAEAHTSLAMVKLLFDWDFAEAENGFRRAVELKPNYATAHQWYGHCLMLEGRFDEAIAEMKRAVELDPLSLSVNTALGYVYWHARRYDEAIAQLNKTLELDPQFLAAISYLGMAYEQKKMYREALAAFHKEAEQLGVDGAMAVMIGRVHALSGNKEKTKESLAKIQSQEKSIPPIYMALMYAALDDKDRAFAFLEKAFEERSSWMPHLKTDPRFDNLRSDPRFQNVLTRIGFK